LFQASRCWISHENGPNFLVQVYPDCRKALAWACDKEHI
jgi:hypothetical protein